MSKGRSGSCVSKTRHWFYNNNDNYNALYAWTYWERMVFNHTWLNGFNEPQPEQNGM